MTPFTELLQRAYPRQPLPRAELGISGPSLSPEHDAEVHLVELTQYAIYVVSQLLVLALSVATTVSLIVAVWRLTTHPDTAQLVVATVVALGSIVVGTAAVFVQRQAREAKKRWEDARNYQRS